MVGAKQAERRVSAAALLLRDDGRALFVRPGRGSELWTLPQEPVATSEVAEQALVRLLNVRLHIQSESVEFNDTIGARATGRAAVINVFTCTAWEGEPRYSERDFRDAAWANPAAPGDLELEPAVAKWLAIRFGADAVELTDRQALAKLLVETRERLLAAFEELPWDERDRDLDEGWTPLDVLGHCASAEAYYLAETQRLLDVAGHTWRPFNVDQHRAEQEGRPAAAEAGELARMAAVREGTLAWLAGRGVEELAAFGDHAEHGAVRVGERIHKIARHDIEHTEQLRAMREALQ